MSNRTCPECGTMCDGCNSPKCGEVPCLPCRVSKAKATESIFQFFDWDHLRPPLRETSAPFQELALKIVETVPRNPERTVALRKLKEAKDAAVCAVLFRPS